MAELVSCILATKDRPRFVRQAIRCFLRQTYDESELIVVDDGEKPVEGLCAGLCRVRYIRQDSPVSLGSKLNIGIGAASGGIIQKLDDDDWYHRQFLERAVWSLGESPYALAAWDCFLILMAGEQQARYSGHGWSAGGTFCFRKELWEGGGFRDVPSGVDYWFLRDRRPRLIRVCAPEMYVLVRHGANTWQTTNGGSVDESFGNRPVYPTPLDDLLEPIDRTFYQSLCPNKALMNQGPT